MTECDFTKLQIKTVESAFVVTVPKGNKRVIKNRESYGLVFVSEGELIYRHKGKEYLSDINHVLLLPKGQTYTIDCLVNSICPLINFQIDAPELNGFYSFDISQTEECFNQFELLEKLLFEQSGFTHLESMSILYHIFAELLKENPADSDYKYQILQPAVKYLGAHLSDPSLNNDVLAQQANISNVYFRKLFTEKYGLSPKQYIQRQRIKKAKELLGSGYFTVTAVSTMTGYSGVYSFCRAFKSMTGRTPREFMRRS